MAVLSVAVTVKLNGPPAVGVPDSVPSDSPYNVAQLYAKLGESIRNGTPATPGFDAAVRRHRLIDTIVRASDTGQKQYCG